MRLAKRLYYPYLSKPYLAISGILLEVGGALVPLSELPDELVIDYLGYSGEDLIGMISLELERDFLENA